MTVNWDAVNAAAGWGALLLGVVVLIWSRIDAVHAKHVEERSTEALKELQDADRADLRFGEMWGGLALDRYDKAGMKNAVRLPLENHGRRDSSVSKAEWVLWEERAGHLHEPRPMFLEPVEPWTGRGDLTIPAGTRRMFRFPLSKKAESALQTGQTIRLYIMPVGRNELTRGDLTDKGITPRPWTSAEIAEGEAVQSMLEEQAELHQG